MSPYLQLKTHRQLQPIYQALLENMLDNLNEPGASYKAQDVRSCEVILDDYLKAVAATKDEHAYLNKVKETVLRLNDLNQKARNSLIETMEREMIADYIIKSGQQMGFNQTNEDITEPWREW